MTKRDWRKADELRKLAEESAARIEELKRKAEMVKGKAVDINPKPPTQGGWIPAQIAQWHNSYAYQTQASAAASPRAVSYPQELFSGQADFAVGEVYGMRTWRLSPAGELLPRNLQSPGVQPWTLGENVATCWRRDPEDIADPTGRGRELVDVHKDWSFSYTESYRSSPWRRDIVSIEVTYVATWVNDDGWSERETYTEAEFMEMLRDSQPVHDAPDDNCVCGFYAYTDPQHEEIQTSLLVPVLGLIKGHGRTLIGSRGFRCQKAEIVALVDPGEQVLGDLQLKYPDIPIVASVDELRAFVTEPGDM